MRTIKFRGKCKDGTWVEGDLTGGDTIHIKPSWAQDGEYEWWGCPVDEKTAGQFIGMLDKNGKEIWEGDIVNYFYNNTSFREGIIHRGIVNYSNENCCFLIATDHVHEDWEITVIGNIFDNPELLSI